jgi:hypothetical protein
LTSLHSSSSRKKFDAKNEGATIGMRQILGKITIKLKSEMRISKSDLKSEMRISKFERLQIQITGPS